MSIHTLQHMTIQILHVSKEYAATRSMKYNENLLKNERQLQQDLHRKIMTSLETIMEYLLKKLHLVHTQRLLRYQLGRQ